MLQLMVVLLGLIAPFSVSPMDENISNNSTSVLIQNAVFKVTNDSESFYHPRTSTDSFETVNDISLWDRKEEVFSKKEDPQEIKEIPFLECTEYEYDDMTIGICDDLVSYVHVDASVGTFKMNGIDIEITEKGISSMLGSAQFHAEDGDVYIRGNHAIKVYKDPLNEQIQGIDFFDSTSS